MITHGRTQTVKIQVMAQTRRYRRISFFLHQRTCLDSDLYWPYYSMLLNQLIVKSVLIGCFFLTICCLQAQNQPIFLSNSSFEDAPLAGKPPMTWYYCGSSLETPPDIHPSGFFEVTQKPKDGKTYVGMVVRTNNTWEGLGQLLEKPLKEGQNYRFCLFACLSANYKSVDRITLEPLNYNKPVIIRIWGSAKSCEAEELLAQSEAVDHADWQEHCFMIKPQQDVQHIRIEAYFAKQAEAEPYGGSVLIDDCSAFIPYNKEEQRYDLDIPPLSPTSSLVEAIDQYGSQINFTPSTFVALEKHLFYDQQNQLQEANFPLSNIIATLKQHPKQTIKITIAASKRSVYKARKKVIQAMLESVDIPKKQYKMSRQKRGKNQNEVVVLIQ